MHIRIVFLFWLSLVLPNFLWASSFEVLQGRLWLTQRNLPNAYTSFANADSGDSEAKVLKSLSAIALLQTTSATTNYLHSFHITSPTNIWLIRNQGYRTNANAPTPYRTEPGLNTTQGVAVLTNTFLPVLQQVETDLATITDTNILVPLGRAETGYPDINLDYGDILMIRALVATGRSGIHLGRSQNSAGVINDLFNLEEGPGPATIESLLQAFPDLAKTANSTDLPIARTEAKESILLYKQASEWIRQQRSSGVVRLFNLPGSFGVREGEIYTASLANEAAFRVKLDEYAALLDGLATISGFDGGVIDAFNGKSFWDGNVNLRSQLPMFRKNKARQGTLPDPTFGGIYPNNTLSRTEDYLWQETLSAPADPWHVGLFIPPSLRLVGLTSLAESYQAPLICAAWGANWSGETDIPAGLANVISIAAGSSHSLALKSDGTVVAWGDNWSGQTSIPAGLVNVISIAAGSSHSLALKSDGTVVAWGDNWSGQTDIPAGLANVISIAAGGSHSIIIFPDSPVTLQRDGDPSEEIPLSLVLTGTAQAGADYIQQAEFNIPSGLTSVRFNGFYLLNDSAAEFDETVTISATTPTNSEASFQPFTITILDDDGTGAGIFVTDSEGKEGRLEPDPLGFGILPYNPLRYEVRRTGNTAQALAVKIDRNILSSSASPEDYEITGFDVDGETVNIPAGQSSAEIVVSPKFDFQYPEGDESLVLQIQEDSGYALTENVEASALILDSSVYESWTYQNGLVVSNLPPTWDLDGDGSPNLLEMALGRDPQIPDSSESVQLGQDADGYLTLTFKRWAGGTNQPDGSYIQYGLTYSPQSSSNLANPGSWSGSSLETVSTVPATDGMETVTIRDNQSKNSTRRFIRVLVNMSQ